MNSLPNTFYPIRFFRLALNGGKAPNWQQRLLARNILPASNLFWACKWVKKITKLSLVKRDTELFGDLLETLVNDFAQAGNTEPDKKSGKRQTTSSPGDVAEINRGNRNGNKNIEKSRNLKKRDYKENKRVPASTKSNISGLDKSVCQDILCRYAGLSGALNSKIDASIRITKEQLIGDKKIPSSANLKNENCSVGLSGSGRTFSNEKTTIWKNSLAKLGRKKNNYLKTQTLVDSKRKDQVALINKLVGRVARVLKSKKVDMSPSSVFCLPKKKRRVIRELMSEKLQLSFGEVSGYAKSAGEYGSKTGLGNKYPKVEEEMFDHNRQETDFNKTATTTATDLPNENNVLTNIDLAKQFSMPISEDSVSAGLINYLAGMSGEDKDLKRELSNSVLKSRETKEDDAIIKDVKPFPKPKQVFTADMLPPVSLAEKSNVPELEAPVRNKMPGVKMKDMEQDNLKYDDLGILATKIKSILDDEARRYGINV